MRLLRRLTFPRLKRAPPRHGQTLTVQKETSGWLRIGADSLTIEVTVRPGSARSGIVDVRPDGLVVAVHSPPTEGRANEELIAIIAKALSIPRSAITLLQGRRGRRKILRIVSANPTALAARIRMLDA